MVLTKNNRRLKKQSTIRHEVPEYNVSVIGAGCVGKSCLINRLVQPEDSFQPHHIPTVSEVYSVPLQRDTTTVALFSLYDTAGSIEFPAMRRLTVSKSDAVMVVYSVDSLKSLQLARILVEEVVEVCGENFPCVLVGNKCDVSAREVTFEKGLRCAVEYGLSYVETSVKEDKNVRQSFDSVLSKIEAVSLKEVLSRRQTEPPSENKSRKTSTTSWNKLKRSSSSFSFAL